MATSTVRAPALVRSRAIKGTGSRCSTSRPEAFPSTTSTAAQHRSPHTPPCHSTPQQTGKVSPPPLPPSPSPPPYPPTWCLRLKWPWQTLFLTHTPFSLPPPTWCPPLTPDSTTPRARVSTPPDQTSDYTCHSCFVVMSEWASVFPFRKSWIIILLLHLASLSLASCFWVPRHAVFYLLLLELCNKIHLLRDWGEGHRADCKVGGKLREGGWNLWLGNNGEGCKLILNVQVWVHGGHVPL